MPYISAYKNYMLVVDQDDFPENPREWDNIGTMLCWHRQYGLGDKHGYASPRDFLEEMVMPYIEVNIDLENISNSEILSILRENDFIILPIYLLDHSELSMSVSDFGDKWDSGQVGWIYVSPEKIEKEYGAVNETTKKAAQKGLKAEIEIYDSFLRGNIWDFALYDINIGELIDTVGGFIGDVDEIKDDILSYLDCAQEEAKYLIENLEWEDGVRRITTIDFDYYKDKAKKVGA
nr:MAG TPA: hypothetical protein [Caudoviricetes sp.]